MNPTTDPVLPNPPAALAMPAEPIHPSGVAGAAGDPILSPGVLHADTTATERKDARPEFAAARPRSPFAIALGVAVLLLVVVTGILLLHAARTGLDLATVAGLALLPLAALAMAAIAGLASCAPGASGSPPPSAPAPRPSAWARRPAASTPPTRPPSCAS